MKYRNRRSIWMRTIATVAVCLFTINTCCYGLATLPASQNPLVKREILATLARTQIRYAESEDAKRLLETNNAQCLLLSSGKYLVTKEVAEDNLRLLRAIIHEDIEALMQILAKEKPYKYQAIKELILSNFPPGKDNSLPTSLYVNDTAARAFEWLSLVEDGVILRKQIPVEASNFINKIEPLIRTNKHNYFTPEFWDLSERSKRIRTALNEGMRFYVVAGASQKKKFNPMALIEDPNLIRENPSLATEENLSFLAYMAGNEEGKKRRAALEAIFLCSKVNKTSFTDDSLGEVLRNFYFSDIFLSDEKYEELQYIHRSLLSLVAFFVNVNKAAFTEKNLQLVLSWFDGKYGDRYVDLAIQIVPLFVQANSMFATKENLRLILDMMLKNKHPYFYSIDPSGSIYPFIQANKALGTEENLTIVLKLLRSKTPAVRNDALKALPLFIRTNRAFATEKAKRAWISNKLKIYDIKKLKMSKTILEHLEELYFELIPSLDDVCVGSQQLVRSIILHKLLQLEKEGNLNEDNISKFKEEITNRVVPGIKVLEKLYKDTQPVGVEIHLRLSEYTQKEQDSVQERLRLLTDISTPTILDSSVADGEHLEVRMHPGFLPITNLNILYYIKLGIIEPKNIQRINEREIYFFPYYHTSIQGRLNSQTVPLLALGYNLGFSFISPDKLAERATIPQDRDTLGYPGAYNYVGATYDIYTGTELDCGQTNIFTQASLGFIDRKSGHMKLIYPKDLEIDVYLATAIIAHLKEEDSELKAVYEEFRNKMTSCLKYLGLDNDAIDQILGNTYDYPESPSFPYKFDADYLIKATESLGEAIKRSKKEGKDLDPLINLITKTIYRIKQTIFKDPLSRNIADSFTTGKVNIESIIPNLIHSVYSDNREEYERARELLEVAGGELVRKALTPYIERKEKAESTEEMSEPDEGIKKGHPRYAFENMPEGAFTLREYHEKTGVPLSTAGRDFNVLEELGLVAIHRASGGKSNEIICSTPEAIKPQILQILESYHNKNDIPKIGKQISGILATQSIIELKRLLSDGLTKDRMDVSVLIQRIEESVENAISKMKAPFLKLADQQTQSIERMLRDEILPILYTFGFDKKGNALMNAFFMASQPERVEEIRHHLREQIGTDDLESLVRKAASRLTESIQKNGFAVQDLSWRAKSFYSISDKLKRKGYNVSDMTDILGIRLYPDIPNLTPLEAMQTILSAVPEEWQLLELQRVSYAIERGAYQNLNLQLLAVFSWKLLGGKRIKIQLQIRNHNSFALDSIYNPVYKKQLIPGLPKELSEISDLNWRRGEYYYKIEQKNLHKVQEKLITEIRARWKQTHEGGLYKEESDLLGEITKTERSKFNPIYKEPNTTNVHLSFRPLGKDRDIETPIQHVLSVEETGKHNIRGTNEGLIFEYRIGRVACDFKIRDNRSVIGAKYAILCQTNDSNRFVYLSDRNPKIVRHGNKIQHFFDHREPQNRHGHPKFAFENMPEKTFTLQEYCQKTAVPISTARRDFDVLERLELVQIDRPGRGKANVINPIIPEGMRKGDISYVLSYYNSVRDIPTITEKIKELPVKFLRELSDRHRDYYKNPIIGDPRTLDWIYSQGGLQEIKNLHDRMLEMLKVIERIVSSLDEKTLSSIKDYMEYLISANDTILNPVGGHFLDEESVRQSIDVLVDYSDIRRIAGRLNLRIKSLLKDFRDIGKPSVLMQPGTDNTISDDNTKDDSENIEQIELKIERMLKDGISERQYIQSDGPIAADNYARCTLLASGDGEMSPTTDLIELQQLLNSIDISKIRLDLLEGLENRLRSLCDLKDVKVILTHEPAFSLSYTNVRSIALNLASLISKHKGRLTLFFVNFDKKPIKILYHPLPDYMKTTYARGTMHKSPNSPDGFVRLDPPSNYISNGVRHFPSEVMVKNFIGAIRLLSKKININKQLILLDSMKDIFAEEGISLPKGDFTIKDFMEAVKISKQPQSRRKRMEPSDKIPASTKEVLTATHARYAVTISNRLGLHLGVASLIANLVNKSKSDVTITKAAQKVNASSLEDLTRLAAEEGDTLIIEAKGNDAMDIAIKIEQVLKDESLLTNLGLGESFETAFAGTREVVDVKMKFAPVILLVGKPGSGKSTVGEIVSKRLDMPYIYLGDIIREKEIKVPLTPETRVLLYEEVHKRLGADPRSNRGFVFDAKPTPLGEHKFIDKFLEERGFYIARVFDIYVSDEIALKRQESRREKSGKRPSNITEAERQQIDTYLLGIKERLKREDEDTTKELRAALNSRDRDILQKIVDRLKSKGYIDDADFYLWLALSNNPRLDIKMACTLRGIMPTVVEGKRMLVQKMLFEKYPSSLDLIYYYENATPTLEEYRDRGILVQVNNEKEDKGEWCAQKILENLPREILIEKLYSYDVEPATVLLSDLLYAQLQEDRTYEIKYDTSRLSPSQIDIIKTYISLLQKRAPNPNNIKARPFSSERGSGESLIAVYCQGRDFEGEGHVDIDIPEGNIQDYLLRITGMVNIALAASNIPSNATEEQLKTGYGPIIGFIKNQYKAILGTELAVPDSAEGVLKTIRYIILTLPRAYRMPTEKIEEYNRLARKALIAA